MRQLRPNLKHAFWVFALLPYLGCGGETASTSEYVLTGDPWVPNVSGAGASNHDSNVAVSKQVLTSQTGALVGLGQGWSGREITVSIDMSQDLGDYGSLTLAAEVTGFPTALSGGASPVLTYLSDGTNELLGLARSGSGGDCVQSGMYTCSSGTCSVNSSCSVTAPSAYLDRTHWEQHQTDFLFFGSSSTNTFPTCNWTGGSGTGASERQCVFNSTFFPSGTTRLRTGTYTAKYVLMTDSYSSVSGYNAKLQVSVIKKSKATQVNSGAVDVNVIFVGQKAAQASRTSKGQINLDSLFAAVQTYYSQSTVNVKLGTIRSYEWVAGEAYADVDEDYLGEMVRLGSSVLSSDTDHKAINIFMVNSISGESSILGLAAGIGGTPVQGLGNSGVLVALFGKLDQYNPSCSAAPCLAGDVEYDFNDLGQTVAHEMGHYFGLNHPSEGAGTTHDLIRDTPICTALDSSRGNSISIDSCRTSDTNTYALTGLRCNQACTGYSYMLGNYCPTIAECQINHMMFRTSKYYTESTGAGDGNIFTTQSGVVMNYHPLIQ